jgi:hypothetical protein
VYVMYMTSTPRALQANFSYSTSCPTAMALPLHNMTLVHMLASSQLTLASIIHVAKVCRLSTYHTPNLKMSRLAIARV